MKNDGYTLTTQRKAIEGNEIPELTKAILEYKNTGNIIDQRLFEVKKNILYENDCNLSVNKYKVKIQNKKDYEPSEIILNRIVGLNMEFTKILDKLKEL